MKVRFKRGYSENVDENGGGECERERGRERENVVENPPGLKPKPSAGSCTSPPTRTDRDAGVRLGRARARRPREPGAPLRLSRAGRGARSSESAPNHGRGRGPRSEGGSCG